MLYACSLLAQVHWQLELRVMSCGPPLLRMDDDVDHMQHLPYKTLLHAWGDP